MSRAERRSCDAHSRTFLTEAHREDVELVIELAILPIGDNFTMGPDDALRALEFVEPRQVLPIHYNTFPLSSRTLRTSLPRSPSWVRGEALDPGTSVTVE